jgi:hypothetical protein
MAVPVVADYLAGSNDTTSPLGITVPGTWSAGDLAFALVHTYTRTVSTPPSGWTALNSPQNSGSVNTYLYYKQLVSGDIGATADWTLNANPSLGRVVLVQVTGHDTTTPINASVGQSDATANSHTSPAVTTTTGDCLVLRLMAIDEGMTWTASSGDTGTNVVTGSTSPSYSIWKSSKATAGSTGSATYSTNNFSLQLFTVAVAPSAGGGSSFAPYLHQPQTWQFVGRK